MLDHSDANKILKKSLRNGGDFAELYFEKTLQTSIVYEDKRIEEIVSGADQGVGLRLINDLKTLYGFTNDLSPHALHEMAIQLSSALKNSPSDRDINFKKQEPNTIFPIKKDPLAIPTDQKVKLCEDASQFAWAFDPKVDQVQITYNESKQHTQILNSHGLFVDDTQSRLTFIVSITVSDGDDLFTSLDAISGHCGYELFDFENIQDLITRVAKRALQNLSARAAPAGKMPVILASSAGGTIIHEAVGHGLEADLIENNMSIYKGKLGKRVASALITVIDDATIAQKNGSFSFDDEGTPSQKTVLIENGMLKDYMCDYLTGLKLNRKSYLVLVF